MISLIISKIKLNNSSSFCEILEKKSFQENNYFSFPFSDDGVLIDFFARFKSASVVAKSEISVRAKSGESIPTGWAFGPNGEDTTDPSIALKGTMAPTGGYKGFGIGLFVEIMTACLTGANLGTEASSFADDKGGPPGTGQFFIAINPAKYSQGFEEKITSLINNIESQDGPRVPGSKRIANAEANADIPINIKEDLYNNIISLQK